MMPSEFDETQRTKMRALINRGIELLLSRTTGKRTLSVHALVQQLSGEVTKSAIETWEDRDLEFFSQKGEKNPKVITDYCRIRIKEKPKSATLKKIVEDARAEQIETVKKIMQGDHHMRIGYLMRVEVPFCKMDLFRRDKKHLDKWGFRIDGAWKESYLRAYTTDDVVQEKFKFEQMTSEASETTEDDEWR